MWVNIGLEYMDGCLGCCYTAFVTADIEAWQLIIIISNESQWLFRSGICKPNETGWGLVGDFFLFVFVFCFYYYFYYYFLLCVWVTCSGVEWYFAN